MIKSESVRIPLEKRFEKFQIELKQHSPKECAGNNVHK